MEDKVTRRIKITVDTGFVGAKHEDECDLPENWDSMSADEQREYLIDCSEDAIHNYIEAYAEVVDE